MVCTLKGAPHVNLGQRPGSKNTITTVAPWKGGAKTASISNLPGFIAPPIQGAKH